MRGCHLKGKPRISLRSSGLRLLSTVTPPIKCSVVQLAKCTVDVMRAMRNASPQWTDEWIFGYGQRDPLYCELANRPCGCGR